MAVTTTPKLMTTEELLAMPDDGMERWLIKGQLREKYPDFVDGKPVTVRNRFHCKTTSRTSTHLNNWRDLQAEPRGEVLDGEVGVRLPQDPDTTLGIDVVYIDAETAARQSGATTVIAGTPVLAIEVLSPSDTQGEVKEKVDALLAADVAHVWVVDPYDQTVKVYRPGARPLTYNADQEITAEPHLPGFHVLVAKLFD
jgi:Uma2 family endonuclease